MATTSHAVHSPLTIGDGFRLGVGAFFAWMLCTLVLYIVAVLAGAPLPTPFDSMLRERQEAAAMQRAAEADRQRSEAWKSADIGDQPTQAACEAAVRKVPVDFAEIGNVGRSWYTGPHGPRVAWSVPVKVRERNERGEVVLRPRRYFILGDTVIARTDTHDPGRVAVELWNGG